MTNSEKVPGQKISTFRCGCCQSCAVETMRFDLMDDGTIAVRENHHLVIGMEASEGKIMLVGKNGTHELVFSQLVGNN